MRKSKKFTYLFESDKNSLLEKINNKVGYYHNYGCDKEYYLVEVKANDGFYLGLKKVGHTGYWFVAKIIEQNSHIIIDGEIIFDPDENGKERKESKKIKLGKCLLSIFYFPILLILYLIYFLLTLFKVVPKPLSKEKKLDKFMLEYLKCKKIKDNQEILLL